MRALSRRRDVIVKSFNDESTARDRFFNREWSWLRFNERVLEEAEDERNPLLERLKFVSIFASNLDEFFMIRVAGLYRQLEAKMGPSGPDRRLAREQIDGLIGMLPELVRRQEHVLARLLVQLRAEGVAVVGLEELDAAGLEYARRFYREIMYPVITPMIVGPKHPFPSFQNCTLCLVVQLRELRPAKGRRAQGGGRRSRIGFVALPRVLPRFLRVGPREDVWTYVPMEAVLVAELESLFAGYEVQTVNAVRMTRDADIALDEEATEDMRRAMAKKLLGRRHGAVVRMQHGSRLEPEIRELLRRELRLEPGQLFPCTGLMQVTDVMQLVGEVQRTDLKDAPIAAIMPARGKTGTIFDWIKRRPRLLYHPYHAFQPVEELVAEAAEDDNVLAIKQTLYRTSGDSPVISALTRAAERGKQVTVVVELRARFDEARNIEWARRLEQAGAHVVYGLVGYKTHCKALLVVRREREGIRRYVHLGTGNYNDATARLYTDMGLFACDELFGVDVSALFNVITGATEPPAWNKVEMSPTGLRRTLLHLIAREIDKSAPRARGRIVAKMNSLVDESVIEALYDASRAGVRVDLIVRGTCCLRPGIPGLSENIRVRSIVGRFLEHCRVLWLRNGGQDEIYLSSADWMSRNLDRRIELLFPLEHPEHLSYVKAVLESQLRDNVKARELQPDGTYTRVKARGPALDSQLHIHDLTKSWTAEQRALVPRRFVALPRGRS